MFGGGMSMIFFRANGNDFGGALAFAGLLAFVATVTAALPGIVSLSVCPRRAHRLQQGSLAAVNFNRKQPHTVFFGFVEIKYVPVDPSSSMLTAFGDKQCFLRPWPALCAHPEVYAIRGRLPRPQRGSRSWLAGSHLAKYVSVSAARMEHKHSTKLSKVVFEVKPLSCLR